MDNIITWAADIILPRHDEYLKRGFVEFDKPTIDELKKYFVQTNGKYLFRDPKEEADFLSGKDGKDFCLFGVKVKERQPGHA